MKLEHLYNKYLADFRAILAAYKAHILDFPPGKTGLAPMYELLAVARRNRAYDDSHPGFAGTVWSRVLPYDGTDYTEYYHGGANDTHLATLLRRIKSTIETDKRP